MFLIVAFLLSGCSKISELTETTKRSSQSAPSIYVSTVETTTESTSDPSETTENENPTEPSGDYLESLKALRKCMEERAGYYNTLTQEAPDTWCFIRKKDHEPSGDYENFNMKKYASYYLNDHVSAGDKVVYLTFDCGYPTNRTQSILDTLEKHDVKANFFVTKMYLEGCPEYAKRMKEEGHMVCNHTVNHEDLTKLDAEDIIYEIFDVAEYFYEITGYPIDPYFRTPTGSYSDRVLTMVKDAGYQTVFWSFAYDDYDQNNQPSVEFIMDHYDKFHHNGAIILMHNDSQANVDALDQVLTYMEEQDYRFGLLDEIYPTDSIIPTMLTPMPTTETTPAVTSDEAAETTLDHTVNTTAATTETTT